MIGLLEGAVLAVVFLAALVWLVVVGAGPRWAATGSAQPARRAASAISAGEPSAPAVVANFKSRARAASTSIR